MRKVLFFGRPTALLLAAAVLLTMPACNPQAQPQDTRAIEAQRSREAANSIRFNANAERDNIVRRLQLTSDPNLLGYIVLLNSAGQPIRYDSVRGKVTSGGKRLTEPDRVQYFSNASGQAWLNRAAPSDEGTFGSSSPYIFYWTTNGEYVQWSGDYIYSDRPIRLRVEPLIVTVVEQPPSTPR